jgi:hypothetical protein
LLQLSPVTANAKDTFIFSPLFFIHSLKTFYSIELKGGWKIFGRLKANNDSKDPSRVLHSPCNFYARLSNRTFLGIKCALNLKVTDSTLLDILPSGRSSKRNEKLTASLIKADNAANDIQLVSINVILPMVILLILLVLVKAQKSKGERREEIIFNFSGPSRVFFYAR